MSRRPPADPNEWIAATLRVGVAVSFVLLTAGLAWTLGLALTTGATPPPIARDPATGEVNTHVVLLLAGLLVLMATPVLRLAACIWSFGLAGDRRYAVVSAVVLAIVVTSVLLSFGPIALRRP